MSNVERQVVEAAAPAVLRDGHDEAFPVLTSDEIGRLRRYGFLRRYEGGAALFEAGKPRDGIAVVLFGAVNVTAGDGLGRVTPIARHGVGHFLGDIGTLSNDATALVSGHADGPVEVLVIPPPSLRAAIIDEVGLGARIMCALALRRGLLIASGNGGPLLIGEASSSALMALQRFLTRNGCPVRHMDPATDPAAADAVARNSAGPADLPLAICPGGVVLRNPSEGALARELGILHDDVEASLYDVAVVGSGPAGLATAVYAASEGLSVVVLDGRAFGGQAGASMRIENYFGFPSGISGFELTSRAYAQAQKFGARIAIPVAVEALDCSRGIGDFALVVQEGRQVRARTVVVASGARYRQPAIDNLSAFEGRGVWYWASPIEARLCAGKEVLIVGGGNSAGQAAVFLAMHAAKVRMVVRGAGLAETMSRYLINRIAASANIEVIPRREIVALTGSPGGRLAGVRTRDRQTGRVTDEAVENVFLFVGADPATAWLRDSGVTLDQNGFVPTGGSPNGALSSSIPGVYAVGDVRAGSVKRVGAAIGEGAQVVAAIHQLLATVERAPGHRHEGRVG
jgi:thioredoxin reductase (NADPH)